jgi:hypothetical protein
MSALLSVSLFLIGCPTETAEKPTLGGSTIIHFDTVVATDADLANALAPHSGFKTIAFHGDNTGKGVDLVKSTKIPADKTVEFFSPVTTKGLEIQGVVYVGSGGLLTAAAAGEVSVTGNGVLYVQKGGALATDAAGSVNDGAKPAKATVLGKTDKVSIAGTLDILAKTEKGITDALGYINTGATLKVTGDTTLAPTVVLNLLKPYASKFVVVTANKDETTEPTTLTVPAQVNLTTDNAFDKVATLTVNGTLNASAVTGDASGVKIVVNAGASATVGTLAKIQANSSVEAGGKLAAVITDASAGLAVKAGATVNGITFPAPTKISLPTAGGVTVAENFTVPASEAPWILGGNLTLNKGVTLTLKGDVNVGVKSLILTADGSNGAKLAGAGAVKAGATEITGDWEAVGASGTVTIAAKNAVESSITGATGVLTAKASGATITQKSGDKNALIIAANTVINFGDNGSLTFAKPPAAEPVATVKLTDATSILKFGTGVDTKDVTNDNLKTALNAKGIDIKGTAIVGKTTETGDDKPLTQILGGSSLDDLTGPVNTAAGPGVIDKTVAVKGEN